MAEKGARYGSEHHLLRYLGRHRNELDRRIRSVTGCDTVSWLDFFFDRKRPWKDREWKGLDFLPQEEKARRAWTEAWPQRGNPPNWDAVGRIFVGDSTEWLLVEAKAHTGELKSSCGAKEGPARSNIESTLEATKDRLDVAEGHDWMNGYYQFCNRLAVLNILQEAGVPARLLFIYFTGDDFGRPGTFCPQSEAEWQPALDAQTRHVGLAEEHLLANRIHKLFLPVCP